MSANGLERPQLARGVRLHWDVVRERHVLLFPEGALTLNPTAAEVMKLCDGDRSVADIVTTLSELYEGADVGSDVRELIGRIADRGLVIDAAS